MLTAPEAPALDEGPLGGLLRQEPGFAHGPRLALGLSLRFAALGLSISAAPLVLTSTLAEQGPSLQPVAAVIAALLWWTALAVRPPSDGARRVADPTLTLMITVAAATAALPSTPGQQAFMTAAGVACLLAALIGPGALRGAHASRWAAATRAPHDLGQALILGAGPLMVIGVALGAEPLVFKLFSRLFVLGLVVHVGLAQRSVAQRSPSSDLLRVGALCLAYRWVLWMGMLAPLASVAMAVTVPVLETPGWVFATALAVLGQLAWSWLDVRSVHRQPDPACASAA